MEYLKNISLNYFKCYKTNPYKIIFISGRAIRKNEVGYIIFTLYIGIRIFKNCNLQCIVYAKSVLDIVNLLFYSF